MAKYDIFISYSRKDTDLITPILDALKDKGYTLWLDTEGKYHSEKFRGKIVKAIKESSCVVFFSSKNSNESEWVRREINVADEENKTIIPFILDDTGYDDEIRLTLTGIERIDTTEISMKRGIDELCDTISRIIDSKPDVGNNSKSERQQNRKEILKSSILLIGIVLVAFIFIYGLFLGIGYGVARFSDKSPNKQIELNQHITFGKDMLRYSNNGLTAEYYLSKDTVYLSKDALYYTIKSEDFWRAASISAGLSLWAKNLRNIPGNGKTKAGVAVSSFFGVLFGYSQGNYIGKIHNMQETQNEMETFLLNKDNWNELKQNYLKREKIFDN